MMTPYTMTSYTMTPYTMTPYMLKAPKTREGALRQFYAVIASYKRDFGGGGSFGWDWPTFRLNCPDRCNRARELLTLAKTLPAR
jgi:hypothetical protein